METIHKNSVMGISIQLGLSEEEFITALINREKWAQKAVYEEMYSDLLLVCLRYASNNQDALDILHDGFIKVFRNISKYKVGTSFESWMRRIMINTSIDYYRREKRRWTEDIENAHHLSGPSDGALEQMGEKEILQAIQSLSPAYRMVFNLYVIEGYSHREIADVLNINESTSRSNLVKARSKLRNIVELKKDMK